MWVPTAEIGGYKNNIKNIFKIFISRKKKERIKLILWKILYTLNKLITPIHIDSIWTCDPLVPNQMRYQAALHSDPSTNTAVIDNFNV